ncbi:DUF222 domain-containing protein [Gordonia sp. L191]|uniref:DUF222 domain-containing protein n=1 Tax=Gordonia sp. L191 TaxID=2982699 RepID=UPI0024BFFEBE|nr:DUF222 domain-containing protein [Gordonia sp. L191]WHU45897.1 DUF222 domain-containing protein [Gordonia sp. L191]
MLQGISLLHEAHKEEYGCEVAEKTSGESSLAEIAESAVKAVCGVDPREQFGPDGSDRTVADVGAVLSMSPAAVKEMIKLAEVARYRLPSTGAMLGFGRIDLQRLKIVAAATELCDPELLPEIDVKLSDMIGSRDQMSTQRFTNMVKLVVSKVDRSVSRRHRERAQPDRGVAIRPDRFRPGQAWMTAQLPTATGALLGSQLDAMADCVHKDDPAGPRGTIFVVANESTPAGEHDDDALIDGYGPSDARHRDGRRWATPTTVVVGDRM